MLSISEFPISTNCMCFVVNEGIMARWISLSCFDSRELRQVVRGEYPSYRTQSRTFGTGASLPIVKFKLDDVKDREKKSEVLGRDGLSIIKKLRWSMSCTSCHNQPTLYLTLTCKLGGTRGTRLLQFPGSRQHGLHMG